ncbi:MAG: hypothetical protein ACRDH7_15300 [Actinomycetota bacterium]
MKRSLYAPATLTFLALVLSGCSNGGASGSGTTGSTGGSTSPSVSPLPATGATPTAVPTLPPYSVNINPADFTNVVTNPYFKLTPGSTRTYTGTKDGVPLQATFKVLTQAKTIIGVKCVVVQDTVTLNGSLEEKTLDWFAQDSKGNVWYFGEDSKDYKNGVVVSTTGTWLSGVNGGQPGIVMLAAPTVGAPYVEEYLPGVAEDHAQVVKSGVSITVPTGSYKNVIITKNTNPLDPSLLEHKFYAPGVGMVYETKHYGGSHMEIMRLVRVTGL